MSVFRPVLKVLALALPVAVFAGGVSITAFAQNAGERSVVREQGVDFFGGDIGTIRRTTVDTCESECLANPDCKGFTYNTLNRACFLKSDVSNEQSFQGAISGRVVESEAVAETPEPVRAAEPETVAETEPAEPALPPVVTEVRPVAPRPQPVAAIGPQPAGLSFLTPDQFDDARRLRNRLARELQPDGATADELVARARTAIGNRLPDLARSFYGAALVADPASASTWLEFSSFLLSQRPDDWQRAQQYRADATASAINSFVASGSDDERRRALTLLSNTLQNEQNWRAAIKALRGSLALQEDAILRDTLESLVAQHGFRIIEHTVDSDAAEPRICVVFSDRLRENGVVFGDYVRVEGGSGLAIGAENAQICISGVEHGRRYEVRVREGLPADDGEVLSRSADLSIYVRDRSPSARFLGRAYVLPRSADATIPVQSVNLDTLDIEIYRIGDRALASALRDGTFRRQLDAYRGGRIDDELGEKVWSGQADIRPELNREVTTALPIGEAVSRFDPGVYAMTARVPGDTETWQPAATQWFIVTDLGLSTLKGNDGLHVFVRSLALATPVPSANLKLVALNNEVLGTGRSDGNGYARFPVEILQGTGGNAPAALIAEFGGTDYAFIDLRDPAFDLTDRGVAGREPPKPIDVFVTTERGAYRPGETIYTTVLARDAKGEAVPGLPLTAILTRPDGVEAERQLLADEGAGGRSGAFALGGGAQRGAWRLAIHTDPDEAALIATRVLVEDFEPEKVEVTLDLPDGPIDLRSVPSVALQADFLFGAPAGGLSVEGETRIEALETLEAYPGYRFGLHDERVDPRIEPIAGGIETDPDGRAVVPLRLPQVSVSTRLLQATAQLRVRDGSGRPVERSVSRSVLPDGVRIGIRPRFDGSVEEGGNAAFDLIAIGADGERVAQPGVTWTLSRIRTQYQWYQIHGNWRYEPITVRERVGAGEVSIAAGEPIRIEAPVSWGQYELRAETTEGVVTSSSMTFNAGWYVAPGTVDTPDIVGLSTDKERYRIGETVRVRLEPRFPGRAVVMVLDDRLIEQREIEVESATATVDFTVTGAWGPGAYITAVMIRPMDVAAGRNPARAVGVSWAGVDVGERAMSLAFNTPDEAQPRGPLNAEVAVTGAPEGEQVYVTIAAVDLGILNLTSFETPKPDAHYFGQRRLGMEMRDLYGQLIDGLQGTPGRLRSGGDGALARFESPPPTQDLVAYFSGVVEVDAEGRASAVFDLPQFNGTVRLMAVAWSETGVGHAEKDVLVRDPVVVSAGMPRFLAPGDRSRLLVEFTHAYGPTGEVTANIRASGGVVALDAVASEAIFTLGREERETLVIPVTANAVGDAEIEIAVTTPGGQTLNQVQRLGVRANDPEIARVSRLTLEPGRTLTVDRETFAGLVPGTGRATLSLGSLAAFDIPGLLNRLDRYPYGCTEQITSQAMPLVYLDDLRRALGMAPEPAIGEKIGDAVTRLLAHQSSSGGFGVWGPGGGNLWLDAYATDFLARAKKAGHPVRAQSLELALDNLRNSLSYAADFERGGEDVAYALFVLAREGTASIGDLRYYADAKRDAFATPMALAQLGAALALYGEQLRSDQLFRLSNSQLAGGAGERPTGEDYGSRLRDDAALVSLAYEARTAAIDLEATARRVAARMAGKDFVNTQESAWMVLAARALQDDAGIAGITVDGAPADGPIMRLVTYGAEPMAIENTGADGVDVMLTTFGVPDEPEPASGNGYLISRSYFTLEGEQSDPSVARQNERLVVVLTIEDTAGRNGQLIIDDPLPAGFEIDNPNILRSGDVKALDWLAVEENPEHVEFRSDRFIAALNMDAEPGERRRLAYIVRAVSPGVFHHPAALVEDMYRPEFRARTAASSIEVVGPGR